MVRVSAVVELCCGLGGATEGLLRAGLTVEATYDLWPVAVAAHLEWHPDVNCQARDVSTIAPEELRGRAVWASLPCQPYSIANQVRRWRDHPHYYPLRHFARQVQYARVAVIENVAGLAQTREGQLELDELHDECRQLGLACSVQVVNCSDHGSPFPGRRTIVIISPDGNAHEPIVPTDVYAGATGLRPLASDAKGGPGRPRMTRRPTANSGQQTFADGSVTKRLYAVEEAAQLQGVPVPTTTGPTNQLRLIGNAVPPRLAQAIAEQVIVPRFSQPATRTPVTQALRGVADRWVPMSARTQGLFVAAAVAQGKGQLLQVALAAGALAVEQVERLTMTPAVSDRLARARAADAAPGYRRLCVRAAAGAAVTDADRAAVSAVAAELGVTL